MTTIENSYLKWVGANHYATIEEYVEEVKGDIKWH